MRKLTLLLTGTMLVSMLLVGCAKEQTIMPPSDSPTPEVSQSATPTTEPSTTPSTSPSTSPSTAPSTPPSTSPSAPPSTVPSTPDIVDTSNTPIAQPTTETPGPTVDQINDAHTNQIAKEAAQAAKDTAGQFTYPPGATTDGLTAEMINLGMYQIGTDIYNENGVKCGSSDTSTAGGVGVMPGIYDGDGSGGDMSDWTSPPDSSGTRPSTTPSGDTEFREGVDMWD